MFILLSALYFLAVARADLTVFNGAVDKILHDTQEKLVKSGREVLHIKDFAENFTYRWHFIKVDSVLSCWDGVVTNVSTLQRTGDVKIANHTETITLIIPLNLTDFEMSFNRCRVDIKHFLRKTAPVKVRIGRNALEANITLNLNDSENKECTATLQGLNVTRTELVKFESAPFLTEVWERILPYMTNHFIDDFIPVMTTSLNDLVKDRVPNGKLCYKPK